MPGRPHAGVWIEMEKKQMLGIILAVAPHTGHGLKLGGYNMDIITRLRAAAYGRYSTELQTENSIAYQLEKIREYCLTNDMDICAVYTDEAMSGTNTERPGFQNLIAAAHRKEFDAVVIYDISRCSRDIGDWFAFRKEMAALGIKVISATQQLGDIVDPNSFLVEFVTAALGQHQVLDARKKSIDGVAVRAKQGVFLGGIPPLGYDVVDQQYVINPREAEAVRRIFSMYADGKSYNYIINQLKDFRGKRGQPLGKNSLNSILKNERYIGVYTWNKRKVKLMRKWAGGALNPDCVRIEGIIPKIIDIKTWERVQKRMCDNKRRASAKAKRTYLLSGLIECAKCGATYVGHTSTNKKGYQSRYYVCGNKYRTHNCDAKNITADELEMFVSQQLKVYLLNTDFSSEAKLIADQINNASPDLSAEKSELAEINNKIKNGVNALLSGMVIPELEEEVNRLRVRKSELEDIIAAHSQKRTTIDPKAIEMLFNDSVHDYSDGNMARVIKAHITKIYANIDGSFTVNIGVHTSGCGGRI